MTTKHDLQDAELMINALRDLVTPGELRDLGDVDPDSKYNLEDLKADYLYDLMVAQSAQAIATVALARSVQQLVLIFDITGEYS